MRNRSVILILLLYISSGSLISRSYAQDDEIIHHKDIFYKTGSNLSEYEKARCFLDLFLPGNLQNFPMMVWFHGGSLERGSKDDQHTHNFASHFAKKGVGVAVVNYRLSPDAKFPSYIEDAAASVAWVVSNIQEYGGDKESVFIAGHSAGGYLTYMLGMDRRYLTAVGLKIDQIAGLIPVSGQTFTHYTIRHERGIPDPENTPVIDEAGPCYHAQKSGPPIMALYGDRDPQDRIEENQYFVALLKKRGYKGVEYREMKERNHWELILNVTMLDDPVTIAVLDFISKHSR
jgi:acetyl esterase/lipase